MRLRFAETACTDPYRNLALEAHLFDTAEADTVTLYLWRNRRTVVIGRNQDARSECRVDALLRDGGKLARRRSGGGAVFHDLGNLNFTFVARGKDYDVGRQLGVVVHALGALGIRAEATGRNDICADGLKVSGNAFQRAADRGCHHGTILVSADTGDMARYLSPPEDKLRAKGVRSVRSRVANLEEFVPGVTPERVGDALRRSFGALYGAELERLQHFDAAAVAALEAEFADERWLRAERPAVGTHALSRRFSWGGVTLRYTPWGGALQDVELATDALETALFSRLRAVLTGGRFTPETLRRAVREIRAEGEEARRIRDDLAALVAELPVK